MIKKRESLLFYKRSWMVNKKQRSSCQREIENQEYTEMNTGLPSYTNRSRASRRSSLPQPKAKIPKQREPKKKRVFHFEDASLLG